MPHNDTTGDEANRRPRRLSASASTPGRTRHAKMSAHELLGGHIEEDDRGDHSGLVFDDTSELRTHRRRRAMYFACRSLRSDCDEQPKPSAAASTCPKVVAAKGMTSVSNPNASAVAAPVSAVIDSAVRPKSATRARNPAPPSAREEARAKVACSRRHSARTPHRRGAVSHQRKLWKGQEGDTWSFVR